MTCILTDDHSRVVLSQQEQLSGSDYINASFVNVSSLYFNCVFTSYHKSGTWQVQSVYCSTRTTQELS